MRDLDDYRRKRDPARTPEPFGDDVAAPAAALAPGARRRFVVQQHAARSSHYDLRLEVEGALASWAVPKGPSLDPKEKRLAVRTEDHPLEYEGFEGVIPAGSYGAGAMIVWDAGTYRSVDGNSPAQGLAAGKLDLELSGHKLRGRFALVRTRGERDWLLLRKGVAPADGRDPVRDEPASVLSGLTVEEVGARATRDAAVESALERAGARAGALDAAALRPALATAAPGAFSRAGWLFELKYDGVRALAVKPADGPVRLVVRTGADRAPVYPEVARAVAKLPLACFAIDGEIVALDASGRSSFERIQRRMGLRDPRDVSRAAVEVPVVFYAFDLLGALGRDARPLPLAQRKEILALFAPRAGVVRYADHVEADGERLYEAVSGHGLEGIVAKKADSPYASGRRTEHWRKIKAPRTACAAIVGWTAGRGGRSRLGALLLGWWRDGELVYAGSVGSGLDERTIDALLPSLEGARLPAPPCRGVPDVVRRNGRFTQPQHACDVRYTEETSAGLLRQPVFLRLRELDPAACAAPAAPVARQAATRADAAAREPDAAASRPGVALDPPLQLTRLEKVFWPADGTTKGDLLAYYEAVWPCLGP
jgi:bifunctional non-homologous end joining protein LigD